MIAVLKTTSPADSPEAPMPYPGKIVPSAKARTAGGNEGINCGSKGISKAPLPSDTHPEKTPPVEVFSGGNVSLSARASMQNY